MTDRHTIQDGLSATVKADGAELCSVRAGQELLWQAGPAWPRHSPVLFPIVGRLRGDTLRHAGQECRLTQHGFARDRRFAWTHRDATSCRLVLEDDAATLAMFPFKFRLELSYAVQDGTLRVGHTVTNTGTAVLPASVGAHPAFRWPLQDGAAETEYRIRFEADEPAPIQRLDGGLLRPGTLPSPVQGRVLPLDPRLFDDDAIIMPHPASRSLRLLGPGGGFSFAWTGFWQLGLWSRRPGGFVCIEPWRGFASPADFDGDFMNKPGLMHIPPGGSETLEWSLRPL